MSQRIARIDTAAVQNNYQLIKTLSPAAKVLAMIKSNGYGHGLVRMAQALAEADALGVSIVDEAVELRRAGILQKIVVMTGVYTPAELAIAAELALDLVVHTDEQLALLEASAVKAPLQFWLKLETGMHRLGFRPEQLKNAYLRLLATNWCDQPPILMTHLANADSPTDQTTHQQMAIFSRALADIPLAASVVNSGGLLAWPEYHYQWVRPGIMLYGISPFPGHIGSDHGLRPVMTFYTRLIHVKRCNKGERISYGGQWQCPTDRLIGTVAAGYGDGYPFHAQSGTPTLIRGVVCPVVGRVCMDMLMVDLSACPQALVGDKVTLWGDGLPVESVAESAATIPYELVSKLSQRVVYR